MRPQSACRLKHCFLGGFSVHIVVLWAASGLCLLASPSSPHRLCFPPGGGRSIGRPLPAAAPSSRLRLCAPSRTAVCVPSPSSGSVSRPARGGRKGEERKNETLEEGGRFSVYGEKRGRGRNRGGEEEESLFKADAVHEEDSEEERRSKEKREIRKGWGEGGKREEGDGGGGKGGEKIGRRGVGRGERERERRRRRSSSRLLR